MSLHDNAAAGLRRRVMTVAWVGLPVVVVAYVLLRYRVDGPVAQVAAQITYLAAPILAAAFTTACAWLASARSRAKVIWSLLAAATSLMFVSETYFSWTHLSHAPASMRDGVFDAINALAFVILLVMLCVALGVDRLGWRRATRVLLDGVAITTLALIVLTRAWVTEGLGGVEPSQALRMAAYGLGGGLIFVLVVNLALRTPKPQRRHEWVVLTLSALATYSVALLFWPWWSFSVMDVSSSVVIEGGTAVLFLLGYYLMFLAGLSRVVNAARPWARVTSVEASNRGAWPGVLVSASVLLAVIVLGLATYRTPEGSPDRAVYLFGLVTATVCMVGRTGLAALEADTARGRMTTDALSGASNPRGFEVRLSRDTSVARRFGDRSALLVVDLDDFREVNRKFGRSAADRALKGAADALRAACPPTAGIFRLSGDEFAVLCQVRNRDEAAALAVRILGGVHAVRVGDESLSASIGFALCPDDALAADTLTRYADVAVAWAKRHGKGRVAGFDHRVAAAMGVGVVDPRSESSTDVAPDVASALVAASDAREPGNFRHSRNVAALACLLAEELQDASVDIERLRLAATLHDVGKIGLPSRGAARARAETPSEAMASRAHCQLGARMLRAAHLDDIALWVLHHHERWDGTGYPGGLTGDETPLESRIIAVADAYDELTSKDRHAGSMSRAAALQEIDQGIGSRFDPGLAELFIRVVGSTQALGWSDEWPAA